MHKHLIDTLTAIAAGNGTILPQQAQTLLCLLDLVTVMDRAELTFARSHDDPANHAGRAFDQSVNALLDYWRGPGQPPAGHTLPHPGQIISFIPTACRAGNGDRK